MSLLRKNIREDAGIFKKLLILVNKPKKEVGQKQRGSQKGKKRMGEFNVRFPQLALSGEGTGVKHWKKGCRSCQ